MLHQNPTDWSPGFHGSEHPDTARLRVEASHIERMVALKRENMDRIAEYLNGLIDKAKEELGHARAGNNEHRRAMLRQHVDEIIAYLKGQALDVTPPPQYGEGANKGHYILDEIAPFFGRVRCVIDQWYDSHLLALYDEMLKLVALKKEPPKAV